MNVVPGKLPFMSDVYSDMIINNNQNPQLESSIFSFDSINSVSDDSVVQIGSDAKVKQIGAKSRNVRNNDMLNSDIANIPFLICSDDRPSTAEPLKLLKQAESAELINPSDS